MDDLFAMDDLLQMGTSMLAQVIHGSVGGRPHHVAETQMAPAASPQNPVLPDLMTGHGMTHRRGMAGPIGPATMSAAGAS
jgi:hypothetical protein